ncbi:MAG: DUF4037 domain-containing protein [Clostridia bacterium]|nr:DUF4037 domain-containing protein [Clostridia bacterium]
MGGLELCEKFYNAYGKEALCAEFSDVLSRIAVGLVGQGSECFGFDDALSQDHDFEPGFCLWVTKADYDDFGFRLERMYAKLPKEFKGFHRLTLSPVGGSRHGVFCIEDFYASFLGSPSAPVSPEHWLSIPPHALACACNGKVFRDDAGIFSAIRNVLLLGYPEDVRLKKIAAHAAMMAQTGLYNYGRCLSRGENGAAQLCVFAFVKHAISLIYLLNNQYEPFYKWVYKGMRGLPLLSSLEKDLVVLSEGGNTPAEATAKKKSMEKICHAFSNEFKEQNLIADTGCDFEKHAFLIQDKIADPSLRNMHIMEAI